MSERFGPAARLRSRGEFTAVQSHGRRVAGRYLTMLAHPNTLGRDRLGIIASKRVGGAVERNRAKRRLRELFRANDRAQVRGRRSTSSRSPSRTCVDAPFPAVAADFQAAWRKICGGR